MIKEEKEKSLAGKISEQFMNGIIIVAPPAITAIVVMWLLNLTEGRIGSFIEKFFDVHFFGIGLISVVLFIWIIGFVFGHTFPQKIINFIERLLDKIPVVKFIYSSVKQFSKAIFESNSSFQKVVLVPYNGSLVMGFLMRNIPDPVKEKLGDEYVCVYMPWSLNMTAGLNLFVKKSELVILDMELEDGLQFILTAGTMNKKEKQKG
ncbi:MAG: DUF502 domain-containing protein [Selenomonadaceae bacterium]|nr:DUF502 domain-containing protein [Selenomonadaceae bacterium]